jgi:hypothetical protein
VGPNFIYLMSSRERSPAVGYLHVLLTLDAHTILRAAVISVFRFGGALCSALFANFTPIIVRCAAADSLTGKECGMAVLGTSLSPVQRSPSKNPRKRTQRLKSMVSLSSQDCQHGRGFLLMHYSSRLGADMIRTNPSNFPLA